MALALKEDQCQNEGCNQRDLDESIKRQQSLMQPAKWRHAGTHPCTRSALSLSILIVDIAPKITTAKNGFSSL